ncbi:hypothetical protein [Luteimonas terrae]|nr:hypothetical protein [Luteimonas terrae]
MMWWRGVMTGACLWMLAGLAQAAGDAGARVVFIAHAVTRDVSTALPLRQWTYATVSSSADTGDGLQLRLRPVWARAPDMPGIDSLSLDDRHAEDRAMRAVLASGFDVQARPDGAVVRPVDAKAWQTLAASQPDERLLVSTRLAALALRPVMLPTAPQAGHAIVRHDRTGDFAALETRMQVRTIDHAIAVLDLEFSGAGLRGHGRQAVRLHDGQPLEARLYLERTPAGADAPQVHRLHVVDMATEPTLDLELDPGQAQAYVESVEATLANPPFSARTDDPALFKLHPTPEGALEPWMPAGQVPATDAMLVFGLKRQPHNPRLIITIGADGRAIGKAGPALSEFSTLRVRDVALLDHAGRPLTGAEATLVQPTVSMQDRQRVDETQLMFPFHLPHDVAAETLVAAHTIRMTGDGNVYRWDRAETVARTAQTMHAGDTRIEWTSPHRAALIQPYSQPADRQGRWTTAVPVDAAGREIPSALVMVWRSLDIPGDWRTPAAIPALVLEAGRVPHRLEIATAEPIAGLRLRHYRWHTEPRTWTFHDVRSRMNDADRATYEREFGPSGATAR